MWKVSELFAVGKYLFKLLGVQRSGNRGSSSGRMAAADGPTGLPSTVAIGLSTRGGPALLMRQMTESASSCPSRVMSVQAVAPQQTQCSLHGNKSRGAGSQPLSLCLLAFGTRKVLEHLTRPQLPCFTPMPVTPPHVLSGHH